MGNSNFHLYLFCIALFIGILPSKAQIGIFYYKNPNAQFMNNRIVSLTEASNQEIMLLGKAGDEKFTNMRPYYARIDKKGNMLFQSTLDASGLYDLNKILILPGQDINIYGSIKNADKYTPYINTINTSGKSKKLENKFSVYSTILNDVIYIDKNTALISETKVGKTDLYNIAIYKVNLQTGEQVWYKNITSESNEYANQLLLLKDNQIIILGKKYNDERTNYVPIIYKLSSSGEVMWKKSLSVPGNFFNQSITYGEGDILYYICGYSRESTGTCETRIVMLNQENENIDYKIFQEISANGIITLNDGNFFIYGSNLIVHEGHVITKAKYVVFNKGFEVIADGQLGASDEPDAGFLKNAPKAMPSSSDLITAIQLSDNRIACGGRLYMPATNKADKVDSDRQNNALVLILSPDGKYK